LELTAVERNARGFDDADRISAHPLIIA
jgi:hypothetical protein